MYTKQEATLLRQQFWTTLGQYLKPIPSAGGQKVNWINYKTGVRYIHFAMTAEENQAVLSIVLSHPEMTTRNTGRNMLLSLKPVFEKMVPGTWYWEEAVRQDLRMSVILEHVSVYRQQDWPALIAFFKQGIVGLDAFWELHKEFFEMN